MEIVELYKDCLYSIKLDGETINEYRKLFDKWTDKDYLMLFFNENKSFLENEYWKQYGLKPETAAASVIYDAYELENYIICLCDNSISGKNPDLDDYFQYLDGKYVYELKNIPVKGYGRSLHTFIRIYALKIEPNVYLVVCGGLKLGKAIQDSPDLKDNVLKRINEVISFLRREGIIDKTDL